MEELLLVKIDSKYCDYLRKYDNRVPYNYKKKDNRPFVGVLFSIDRCKYFAPLSSPKKKHLNMRNSRDFLKLDGGKLGAINFNNMLPVLEDNIELIDFSSRGENSNDVKYMNLLKKQIFWLNRNNVKLYTKSLDLYKRYIEGRLEEPILKRCCNFKLLEEKCLKYEERNVSINN